MKVYLAGKITGLENFKEIFGRYEQDLKNQGHKVMNPAILPKGFEQSEYLKICSSMIDVCDMVCFIPNWIDSKGAHYELGYALGTDKIIEYL